MLICRNGVSGIFVSTFCRLNKFRHGNNHKEDKKLVTRQFGKNRLAAARKKIPGPTFELI
ncbi:MAG TPA: hypothetical protein DCO83_02265 [Mucilaginibacter sp.]|jgi:hypothetical protein|nr:hypothetical protein [Mucilaginibacter sp.]